MPARPHVLGFRLRVQKSLGASTRRGFWFVDPAGGPSSPPSRGNRTLLVKEAGSSCGDHTALNQ